MANPQGTNTKPLQTFLNLQSHEQMAIVLKTEGKTYEEIVGDLKQEFNKDYSVQTIKWWFMAGGKLEQAYLDYLEELGNEAIKEGKLLIRRGTRAAATTLISKLKSNDETIQVRAALGLLNKYVPDRQVLITEDGVGDDDLPEELSGKADEIVTGGQNGGTDKSGTAEQSADKPDSNSGATEAGGTDSGTAKPDDGPKKDGSEPVDDTRKGSEDQKGSGDGSGENVPEGVLQEREATDTPGDPAT